MKARLDVRRAAQCFVFLFLAPLVAFSNAAAESYPSGTIRIVVPSSVGTPPDIISRIVATELAAAEGWPLAVENRVGGSQTIGVSDVLKQNSDGHTVLAVSVPLTAIPAILPNINFRLEKDFAPVVQVSRSYNVLVVDPSVPANSISELVTFLKAGPDHYRFSSGGIGVPSHLIGEMFRLQTGVRTVHIPYQQTSQAIGDLLNGTNQYMFIPTLPVVGLVQSGKLRALAVTSSNRISALPETPSVREEGFPGLVATDWVGFAVKAGTPVEIIGRLNASINKALAKSGVRDAIAKVGAETVGGTPSDFGDLMKSQVAHWAEVVRQAGVKASE
jgi:tripartite-type tricarboxylate transporter receptor subunit TctC